MSSMDPFDEFEFKPLTDGLGFHKKSLNLKDGFKSTGVVEDELRAVPLTMPNAITDEKRKATAVKKHSFEEVLSALERTPLSRASGPPDLQFTEPLPRERHGERHGEIHGEIRGALEIEPPRSNPTPRSMPMPMPMSNPNLNQSPIPVPVQSPFPEPSAYKIPGLKKVPTQTALASVGTRRGAADSPQRKLQPAAVSFASALLDGIIVMALSIVFLIALLMVTKVDIAIVLNNLDRDRMTQVSLFVLFIAVMQMYVIVARAFFGQTLGEWTFDLQLGQDADQQSESYPLRVAWRSLLNTVTGLVLLPVVSAVMGRDLAGQLSGVQLYRQQT